MTDEQIDVMVKMHRHLIQNEINHAFQKFTAVNGNEDYEHTANLQEIVNNTEWDNFSKWFKVIKDK